MDKRALITGITGQDGPYLAKYLIDKGYEVFGTFRRLSTPNFWRLSSLKIQKSVSLIPMDLADSGSISESLIIAEPDEVYHLAAQSFVGASFETPTSTGDITGLSVTRMLESIRNYNKDIKFYFASTSELFGNSIQNKRKQILSESDKFEPASPYASAKLYGHWQTKIYREAYNMFCVNGILFNHESPLRGLDFVTRKISNAVAKIKLGLENKLYLGNIEAKRDWGYAPEYVEAMWKLLQHDRPMDVVIATGEAYSVRDFLQMAFEHVGLNYEDYVELDKRFLRPLDVPLLRGDSSKAKSELNWEAKVKTPQLVKIMVDADLERWNKHLNGEFFSWDAPNYKDELNIVTRVMRM